MTVPGTGGAAGSPTIALVRPPRCPGREDGLGSRAYASTMAARDATSLRRGLNILIALASDEARQNAGLGVVRVAALVDSDKSQVSRSLKTLAEYGLVERDDQTLAYRLGWRLFAIAGSAGDARVAQMAQPVLRHLAERFGESMHLTVLLGTRVLTVLSETPDQHTVQATAWVGRTVPAQCTSSGRALLFDHTRQKLQDLFQGSELAAPTAAAPHTVAELYDRIAACRAQGFATVDAEFEPGLVGVAAPIRDFGRTIVAAINLSAPGFRFASRLNEAGAELRSAADALSALLGAFRAGG